MILKQRDIMIDLETLATGPDSVILTIGALRFDPYSDDSSVDVHDMPHFYCRVDPSSFDYPEAEINDETMAWWGRQSPEAQEAAFGEGFERLDIRDALEQLFSFCRPCDRVWANGPAFDIIILETCARRLGKQWPWQFWQARDVRTVFKMVPSLAKRNPSHDALDDCWRQAVDLQYCLRELKVSKMD